MTFAVVGSGEPFTATKPVAVTVHVLPLVSMMAALLRVATMEPFGDGFDVKVLLKVVSENMMAEDYFSQYIDFLGKECSLLPKAIKLNNIGPILRTGLP